MELKTAISVIAVALAFIGYAPYLRDVVRRKTTPHAFTWLVWTLAVGISCALQIAGGAGVGAWTTAAVTLICVVVLGLSLFYGTTVATKSDVIFLILALIALALWVFARQPVWSAILIVLTDVLGFVPTVRKSWNNPHSETLSMYEITGIRHGLSIFALQQYNILTLLYPITWVIANLAFSALLIARRAILSRN